METQTDLGGPDADSRVPIAEVFTRIGHELAHLARRLEHFENVVAPFALEAARRDADLLRQMQGIDHIRQKLYGLADFLAALAPAMSGGWMVDPSAAARSVTLADLAARLSFSDEDGISGSTVRGDFEFF